MHTRPIRVALAALAMALLPQLPALAADTITLKASHQFPGGKGDVRDEMVQIIAREVAAANVASRSRSSPAPAWSSPTSSGRP
jgi:TRAP-type C4-dicarboxylate transport system substrate-binding protein